MITVFGYRIYLKEYLKDTVESILRIIELSIGLAINYMTFIYRICWNEIYHTVIDWILKFTLGCVLIVYFILTGKPYREEEK